MDDIFKNKKIFWLHTDNKCDIIKLIIGSLCPFVAEWLFNEDQKRQMVRFKCDRFCFKNLGKLVLPSCEGCKALLKENF